MVEPLSRGQSLVTDIALVQEPLGIPLYLHNSVILDACQEGTASMIQSGAMCLYPANIICHYNRDPFKYSVSLQWSRLSDMLQGKSTLHLLKGIA